MTFTVQLEGRGTPRAVKLLLDENLSPSVAKRLCSEDGIDACQVRDRNMLGWEDAEVLEKAFTEDRIVVTCNVVDFVKLAHAREIHAGIVLIDRGSLVWAEQLAIIRAAVAIIQNEPDLVNRVLWVNADGTMKFEDIPPA
jgi:predicted nuclease of predicted toxin-antitoxin system